jgi:hypothetical protein
VRGGGHFLGDLRVVLRRRDFRRLYATRLVSQTGDGVFEAGLGSLFFFSPQRAATAGGVAAAIAVAVLPYTLIGPFAGVLLDRWSRRQVLVRANLVRFAMVVTVAGLVWRGAVGPPLYVVVLGCLSVNRFFLAGLGASLPHVVPPSELVMANAVSPTSGTIVALLGGGLAFGVRNLLGAGDRADAVILVLAAAWYASAALTATRMHPALLGPDAGQRLPWHDVLTAIRGVATGLREAGRHVVQRRPALHALALIGAQRFAFGMVTLTVILLCRATFADPADPDAGARRLASVFLAAGGGLLLAAVLTPIATRAMRPWRWIVCCCVAAAGFAGVFAAWTTFAVALAAGFGIGAAMQGSKICVDAIVQRSVDDAFRGRVMSFYDVVFNVAFVSAATACAFTVPPSGRSPGVIAVVGGAYLIAGVLYARASITAGGTPAVRRSEAGPRSRWPSAAPGRRGSGPR